MDNSIQIVEKPEWISWDDIHNLLWQAHAKNRENGVYMRYPSLPGDEIRQRVEGKGKMLVALLEGELVGTSALVFVDKSLWCGKGKYAYCCFDSVSPRLQGRGVYKKLCEEREKYAMATGVSRMLLDTNERNQREIMVVENAGFKRVDVKWWGDHLSIVFVKWLKGCPYSDFRCKFEFEKWKRSDKIKRILKSLLNKQS